MLHWHRKRKSRPELDGALTRFALRHRGDGAIAALGVVLEFDKRGMARLRKRYSKNDIEGIVRSIIGGGLIE